MSAPSPRRYAAVGVAAAAALWMYVDRVCFSTLAGPIAADLRIADDEMRWSLSLFFLSYGLLQVPAGALADRYGPRRVLTLCVVGWSAATAATAFAAGRTGLELARLALGAAEAGAYPAATGLVRRWARPGERGRFSSIVTFGGRAGGALAPFLTARLAVLLAGATFAGLLPAPAPGAANWRAVLLAYGLSGFLVAAWLWLGVRDRPAGAPPDAPAPDLPLWAKLQLLARSRNLWLFGGMQAAINVPWAFLVTLLPRYLETAHGVPLEQRGAMQSVPLVVGFVGLAAGGFATDLLTRRYEARLGRALPLGISLAGAALASACVPLAPGAWGAVALFSVMAFCTDFGIAATWSFAQDVGGRHVSAAAGWGNMWGNLGAFASPHLLGGVAASAGWPAAFALFAGSFALAALCGARLRADRPLE